MKEALKIALVAIALSAGSVVAQQTVPDLARIFEQSKVGQRQDAVDGCRWRYDKNIRDVVCAKRFLITLSPGESTTVNATSTDKDGNINYSPTPISNLIKPGSYIACGCDIDGTSDIVCNERATWIGRWSVASVTNGQFVLHHSWARGDEKVTCTIG